VHIRLEDVSYSDRAAATVAETVIAPIEHPATNSGPEAAESTKIVFSLDTAGASIDAQAEYGIRVWVDIDSDGIPGPNDLHSDRSHRVLTRGFGNDVKIALEPTPRAR
jgi:hypothetical protein